MLKKIFEDIRKKGSFSFEKIIENYTMSDDEFFEFLKFIYLENVPEVRNSTDGSDFIVLEDENVFVAEKDIIKSYLENIKEKYEELEKKSENEKEKEELIDKYLKIAVRESLLYSKYGFSFLDMVMILHVSPTFKPSFSAIAVPKIADLLFSNSREPDMTFIRLRALIF